MAHTSNKKIILTTAVLMILVSSCGLFRKKNRCNTCPTFDDMPAAHEKANSSNSKISTIERNLKD